MAATLQKVQHAGAEALTKLGFGNQITVVDGQPYSSLASGHKIPMFGLGTWSGGQEEDLRLTYEAVKEAIKQGYRHIDCAYCYGNEPEVGKALTECFQEGLIKREDVFITTKLWIEFHDPSRAREVLKKQLQDLQLKYLDLYLIHNPFPNKEAPREEPPHEVTWKALEDFVDEGLVRTIGVSNFSEKKLKNLQKHAKKPISVHQIEVHPVWKNEGVVNYCQSNNIHVTAYSPLGASSSDSQRAFKMIRALEQPIIKSLAEKYGKSEGQIALRWGLQRGMSVVPKSTNPKRIKDNFGALDFELSKADFDAISSGIQQVRALRFAFMYRKGGPYRSYEEFWDEPDHLEDFLKKTDQLQLLKDAQKDGVYV